MANIREERFQNPDRFQFRPWPIWDPAPIWWLEGLERAELDRLALISVELQRDILSAQLKAVDSLAKSLSAKR